MASGLGTGAGSSGVNVYHEKSRILPDVSRVLACLYEKNVEFKAIKASYKDLLSLQVSRSVPVPFYDGPVFLQDSRAICRYIAEKYEHQGYPFLLGKDVLERASIEQWLRHEEHAFDPPSRALFCHLAFPQQYEDDDSQKDINQETRKLEEVLEVYEQRLAETEFLAGNKFTLADLVHLPGTHHIITSDRFAYLYDSRKNVQRWWDKISARDSWKKVLRDIKTVDEQHKLEKQQELEEQQKQQWQTEPLPTFGGRDIHIDPRKQKGTTPHTVLVAPPSTGTISASVPQTSQDRGSTPEKPPPPLTDPTTQTTPSSVNGTKSAFFTPSAPSSAKTHQQTDEEKPSSKTESSPRTSQRSPKQAPDKPQLSDSINDSGRKDNAATLAKPSSQDSSKIPRAGETTDKAPDKIDELNSSETESRPTNVSPQVDKPVPLTDTTPDIQTTQTSYEKPPQQEATDTSVGAEPSQKQKSVAHLTDTPTKGDTSDVIEDDNRFSTTRLRAMFNPDHEVSQYPSKQEEAPTDPKKHSDEHDREKQTTMIPDSEKSDGSPSSDMRAPSTPVTDEERSAILPPRGNTTTAGAEKSPSNQQLPPAASSTDKLATTAGMNTRAPQGTTSKTKTDDSYGTTPVNGADPSNMVTIDEQSEKNSTMGKKVLEAIPKKPTPAEKSGTSVTGEEVTHEGYVKQGPAGQEDILDVQGTGDGDSTKKSVVDKGALEQSSRHKTESDKRAGHALQGFTDDESTKAAQPAPEQAPAISEHKTPTVSRGGTLDTNGKESVTPSLGDPKGTLPTTPGKLAPIPAEQQPSASGVMAAESQELPLSEKRNEKTVITETNQISSEARNQTRGRQVAGNSGQPSYGPSAMKSQEYVSEIYKEQDDQSGTKVIENMMRQDDNEASNAKTGKRNKDDYTANADSTNNSKTQATTADAQSKLQIQSDKNKPETSKDGAMGINETAHPHILEKSSEVQPSSPEKSAGQKQLQENRAATSPQGNVKSTDAPQLRSGTEQQKKDDHPTEEHKNNGKTPEVR